MTKSILLPCPRCGEADACFKLLLSDLDGDEALECQECGTSFGIAEVRSIIAKWSPVIAWIDQAPISQPKG